MSKRMNYGTRFGTNYVGGPIGYTPDVNRVRFHQNKSAVELSLIAGKAQANSKHSKARMSKLPNGDPKPPKVKKREEYEKEIGELIAEMVSRLENALDELNRAPPFTKGEVTLINRRQLMEAISRLKTSFHQHGLGRGISGGGIGAKRRTYK